MHKKIPKFYRADTIRLLRLGKKRRKLQKWRKPRGLHNKTRLKRFSYPVQPGVGFANPKATLGRVSGLIPMLIHNLSELFKANSKENIIIIARSVGAKKRIEIIKKANELGITIANLRGKKWN